MNKEDITGFSDQELTLRVFNNQRLYAEFLKGKSNITTVVNNSFVYKEEQYREFVDAIEYEYSDLYKGFKELQNRLKNSVSMTFVEEMWLLYSFKGLDVSKLDDLEFWELAKGFIEIKDGAENER